MEAGSPVETIESITVAVMAAIDAVIFDWGGTLTRWHDIDFHAESLALAQAVLNSEHDRNLRSLIRLIEKRKRAVVYTDLADQLGEIKDLEMPEIATVMDFERFPPRTSPRDWGCSSVPSSASTERPPRILLRSSSPTRR